MKNLKNSSSELPFPDRQQYTFSTNRIKGNWVEIWGERPRILCNDSLGLCFVKNQSLVRLPELNLIVAVHQERTIFKS